MDPKKTASMRLGAGGRFKKMKHALAMRGAQDPAALAAFIGRKKYGSQRFNAMAAAGRRRAAKE